MVARCQALVLLCLGIPPAASCRGNSPSKAGRNTVASSRELTAIGESLYALELRGARIAFSDSAGGEGAEDLRHTVFASSIVMLRAAIAQDSTDGQAWHWLGEALADRAYLGFGDWDSATAVASVNALQHAQRFLAAGDPIRATNDSLLASESKTVVYLRRKEPR